MPGASPVCIGIHRSVASVCHAESTRDVRGVRQLVQDRDRVILEGDEALPVGVGDYGLIGGAVAADDVVPALQCVGDDSPADVSVAPKTAMRMGDSP